MGLRDDGDEDPCGKTVMMELRTCLREEMESPEEMEMGSSLEGAGSSEGLYARARESGKILKIR